MQLYIYLFNTIIVAFGLWALYGFGLFGVFIVAHTKMFKYWHPIAIAMHSHRPSLARFLLHVKLIFHENRSKHTCLSLQGH